ncbi:hypothetical protein [Actinopolyspora mortivallis]|uniref:Uncharacterized protein n=1 Tax=Actinopolyspora mortivallis TaxID=33906 RepID=A0A2T0GZC5_ACTMO|nr:hypothetical protein [Actinopolyspora mortivallis]PRW64440.1 hypothetical protein CEP50_05870 [Actinopolyspora mortivallis]
MSVLWISLRRSGAVWAALPVLVFTWAVARDRPGLWNGDWSMASGHVSASVLWPVALVAAVAAWDTSRMRRLGAETVERSHPRSGMAYLLLAGLPALVLALLCSAVLLGTVALSMRGGGQPLWTYLAVAATVFVAGVAVGVAGGYVLPRYLAAPAVGIGLWLVLAYGSISDNKYVRALVVRDIQCCDVSREPLLVTLVGQWLWLVAVVLGCAAVLCWRRPRLAVRVGLLGLVVLLGSGKFFTEGHFQLTTMRQPAEGVCRHSPGGARVCMWPAHSADLDRWIRVVDDYRSRFPELDPADSYVEKGLDWSGGSARISAVEPGTSDTKLLEQLAVQTVSRPPECARSSPAEATASGQHQTVSYRRYPGMGARALLRAWILHRLHPEVTVDRLDPPPDRVREVERLLEAPAAPRREWVRRAVPAVNDCTTPMPELPA